MELLFEVLLMGGGFGRIFLVCEQIVEPDEMPPQRVFVFEDYTPFPTDSAECAGGWGGKRTAQRSIYRRPKTPEMTPNGDAGVSACRMAMAHRRFGNLTEDLREIKAGKEHLLALTVNGQVFACGKSEYGSPPTPRDEALS